MSSSWKLFPGINFILQICYVHYGTLVILCSPVGMVWYSMATIVIVNLFPFQSTALHLRNKELDELFNLFSLLHRFSCR